MATVVTRTRLSLMLYVHCLSCSSLPHLCSRIPSSGIRRVTPLCVCEHGNCVSPSSTNRRRICLPVLLCRDPKLETSSITSQSPLLSVQICDSYVIRSAKPRHLDVNAWTNPKFGFDSFNGPWIYCRLGDNSWSEAMCDLYIVLRRGRLFRW
jgi:hypothetical protein